LGKRRSIIFVVVLIVIFLVVSCSKPADVAQKDEGKVVNETENIISDKKKDEEEKKIDGVICPLCGEIIEEDRLYARPVAVMFDNHSAARPQAGLEQADIVYEILAEGNITRYMALFMHDEGQKAGPVRSARRYYIDKSMEHDAIYMHAGGSPEAWDDIARLKIPSLDAMSLGRPVFWRENHRKMPHNIYANLSEARKMAEKKGYRNSTEVSVYSFNSEDTPVNGQPVSNTKILYPPKYKVSYNYSADDKVYYRYVMDKPHVDENDSQYHIYAKNIIIMKAVHKVVDSAGRRKIDLVGKGEGIYISDGSYIPITWEKKDRESATKFSLENGENLQLNPGKTWVQVVPLNALISLE